MSSSWLCSSMPFLSEKEALETWNQSEIFSCLPPDAEAHSFNYIRRMVSESKKKIQDAVKKEADERDRQMLADEEEEDNNLQQREKQEEHERENKLRHEDGAEDDAATAEKEGLVFELSNADDATLEMFVREEEEEVNETIKKQKELVDVEDEDADENNEDGANPPENDAARATKSNKKDEAVNKKSDENKDNDDQNEDTSNRRRQRDGNNGATETDAANNNTMMVGKVSVDIDSIITNLNFQPSSSLRYRGRIKTFLADHGYGFIQPAAGLEVAEKRRLQEEELNRKRQARIQKMLRNDDDDQQQQQEEKSKSSKKTTKKDKKQTNEQEQDVDDDDDEEKIPSLAPLSFNPADVEIFVSLEDVLPLGAAVTVPNSFGNFNHQRNNNHHHHNSSRHQNRDPLIRTLKTPCPGEEVEFSLVVSQTNHGKSLRAVRLSGPSGSPLIIQMSSMRQRGVVRLWDAQRKFGFLTPVSGPPQGLATLSDGRISQDSIQAIKKTGGDVFTLASSVVWHPNIPSSERVLQVGNVVEYTAFVRKGGEGKNDDGNNNSGNKNNAGGGNKPLASRIVAVCVTDFNYRSLEPQNLEKAVFLEQNDKQQQQNANDGQNNNNNKHNYQNQQAMLSQALGSGSLLTARPTGVTAANGQPQQPQFGFQYTVGTTNINQVDIAMLQQQHALQQQQIQQQQNAASQAANGGNKNPAAMIPSSMTITQNHSIISNNNINNNNQQQMMMNNNSNNNNQQMQFGGMNSNNNHNNNNQMMMMMNNPAMMNTGNVNQSSTAGTSSSLSAVADLLDGNMTW